MRKVFARRILAALLSALLVLSLFAAGAMADTSTQSLHWGPEELAAASDQVSLSTPEVVGMSLAPGGSGWYMLYGLNMNIFAPDGSPIAVSGDEITFVVHAYAPDEQPSDLFLQLDMVNGYSQFIENITPSAYAEAEEKYSTDYDYSYKELSLTWTVPDDFDQKVYEQTQQGFWQLRVRGFNAVTTNLYHLAILINGEVYYECDGDRIFNSAHENGHLISAVKAPASAKSIAVKASKAENPADYSNRIFDGLGGELAAGNYKASITFSNRSQDTTPFDPSNQEHISALSDKLFSATLNGAGDPITVDYTKEDLLTRLNIASCTAYDTITIPFTLVSDGTVGLDITHYGLYDLLISDVAIERVLTREEQEAAEVNEAIAAIGEVTEETYAAVGPRIERAEAAYAGFVTKYGQEKADAMITGVESMTAARAEYDRIAASKPQAAIQAAIDAIAAIGQPDSINEANYKSVKKQVILAKRTVQNLVDTYGEETLSSVSNYGNIQAAEKKIAEIEAELAKPEYVLGKVNDDDRIDAADALMALQHSVRLITLTDDSFLAADVDGNGTVDASDALYILQYSVNLIERFPAEKADSKPDDTLEPNPGPQMEVDLKNMIRVTDRPYNAKGDGKTNDRAAIQAAIDDTSAAGGGTVALTAGKTFVTANLFMRSNVVLYFEDGAKLKQTKDDKAFVKSLPDGTYEPFEVVYGHVIYPEREWDVGSYYNYPFLYAGEGTKNITITGNGTIELSRGRANGGGTGCEDTIHMLAIGLTKVDGYELSGFTIQQYNAYATTAFHCSNGLYKGLTIKDAADSACDGIALTNCQNIRVTECNLTTSDDGIYVCCTYGDPRASIWFDSASLQPSKNIEIDHNHCEVTWDATKAFCFIMWGSQAPDPRQAEVSNIYVHDNHFQTMGAWTGSWNLETHIFEQNGTTNAMKNIRFENNEIGTIQDNFYTLPISDLHGYDCMRTMRNGDFESLGDLYWVSRAGGSAGAREDAVGQEGKYYGYIDNLSKADSALYQGLKCLDGYSYDVQTRVQSSGDTVRLFVKDQNTQELIASQEFNNTEWQEIKFTFQVPKAGNYQIGVERGNATKGWARIDSMSISEFLEVS